MSHRPVCVKCEVELYPEKNDIRVLDTMPGGSPYKIWCADKWKCPICGIEIVTGFGLGPIAEHYEPGFDDLLANTQAADTVVLCKEV